jgi:serine/threonine protein kinase
VNWKQLQGQSVDGEFQLVEHLGGTDESATFRTAASDGAKAAVKLVLSTERSGDLLARWKAAETFSHPHLLRVFRSGTCELTGTAFHFVVMEFAEENLAQVLPERALSPDEVREMLPPVLDALEYLHGKELVHGNLKPGNIMAAGDQLKLSTDSLMHVGDPLRVSSAYSAPEALRGVTPATDIWSLGATLTEVLTQRRPILEPGSTLAQLPDNLPEQFRVMVQRCLIPDPALRGTIADIRERLKRPAAVPSAVLQAKPALAQKKSPLRFAVPAGIATVAIGTLIAISHNPDAPPQPETTVSQEAALHPTAPAPVQSPPPAVFTEATDPKPVPVAEKAEPDKPQKLEVLMPEKASPNAPAPPPKPQPLARPGNVSGSAVVVQKVLPDVPPKAMRTINGKFRVQVKVRVNRDGDVVGSDFASRGPSKYFADLTMQAAKQWKFGRADTDERAWNLEFEFRRSGITTNPTQVNR